MFNFISNLFNFSSNKNRITTEDLLKHQEITNSNIPIEKIPWDVNFKEYKPIDVKINPSYIGQSFCEAEDEYLKKDFNKLMNIYGNFLIDKNSRKPLNPIGRTGKINRGDLAKWGSNPAADPLIYFKKENEYYILLIQRADSKTWALPGGMVDSGEHMSITAQRELQEEVGISIDMRNAKKIYSGYVFDPRNTDNAWMVTSVYEKDITDILKLNMDEIKKHLNKKTDEHGEVLDKGFFKLNYGLINSLYASHGDFIKIFANRHNIKIPNDVNIVKFDLNEF